MKEELEYLDYTLKKLDEEIDDSKLKIKNIKELYKFDYEAMLEEKDKLEKIRALNKYIEENNRKISFKIMEKRQ